uniref:Uncharacterized protein n=1 Tax=Plectus sambesii TaxID=2011161 RepID=A0A914VKP5_9BILA
MLNDGPITRRAASANAVHSGHGAFRPVGPRRQRSLPEPQQQTTTVFGTHVPLQQQQNTLNTGDGEGGGGGDGGGGVDRGHGYRMMRMMKPGAPRNKCETSSKAKLRSWVCHRRCPQQTRCAQPDCLFRPLETPNDQPSGAGANNGGKTPTADTAGFSSCG